MSLYFDGQHYNCRYKDYKLDEQFWKNHTKNKSGRVLELCAGTGRLTRIFSDDFTEITGVDNSISMLEQAQKNNSDKRNIKWLCADIEHMELNNTYDHIFMGGLSLGGFSKASFNHILTKIDSYLKPNGTFVFDGLTYSSIGRSISNPTFRYSYHHPTAGMVNVFYKNKILENIEEIDLFYHIGNSVFKDHRIIHYYEISSLVESIRKHNYDIEFLYSDYDGNEFEQNNKMFIISIRKGDRNVY